MAKTRVLLQLLVYALVILLYCCFFVPWLVLFSLLVPDAFHVAENMSGAPVACIPKPPHMTTYS